MPLNKLDRHEIAEFIELYSRPVDDYLLDAIIRRTDTDEDELLSYAEFTDALTYVPVS